MEKTQWSQLIPTFLPLGPLPLLTFQIGVYFQMQPQENGIISQTCFFLKEMLLEITQHLP